MGNQRGQYRVGAGRSRRVSQGGSSRSQVAGPGKSISIRSGEKDLKAESLESVVVRDLMAETLHWSVVVRDLTAENPSQSVVVRDLTAENPLSPSW